MAKTLDSLRSKIGFSAGLCIAGILKIVQNVVKKFCKKKLFFDLPTLKLFKKLHETRIFLFRPYIVANQLSCHNGRLNHCCTFFFVPFIRFDVHTKYQHFLKHNNVPDAIKI